MLLALVLWYDPCKAQQTVSGHQIQIHELRKQKLWLSLEGQREWWGSGQDPARHLPTPCPRLGINTVSLSRSLGETIIWAVRRNTDGLHYDFLSCLLLHSNKIYSASGGSHLLPRESQIPANQNGSKMGISWDSGIMVSGWRNCRTPTDKSLYHGASHQQEGEKGSQRQKKNLAFQLWLYICKNL